MVKAIWTPSSAFIEEANITKFISWLGETKSLHFSNYEELWQWSCDNIESFWEIIVEYFDIDLKGQYKKVMSSHSMPGVKWFEGAKVNYSAQLFKNRTKEYPALICKTEKSDIEEISWDELYLKVAALSEFMRGRGVKKGDRVVAYMGNLSETVVAFLACASLGAIWSSCSPDFGSDSVIERFKQIKPKMLFAVNSYTYGGKAYDKTDAIKEIISQIPEIKDTIILECSGEQTSIIDEINTFSFSKIIRKSHAREIEYEFVEFNDPLWVLYSSGTTGIPKAITHSQGGIIIEHIKYLKLHSNIKPGSRFFWFSTTGWMMWNFIMGSLLSGASAILYDGSPVFPNINFLWDFAEKVKMETFGTSAAYLMACKKAGLTPSKENDLSSLKSIGSTGSPLPIAGFEWCYSAIKKDLWLNSVSGGTDICSVFTGGLPTLPVYAGEIQCRSLGAKVESYDDNGIAHIDTVGEMVISEAMPSMPIYFWNDKNNERYKESYFETYPSKWRHGDWIEITKRGGAIISGRSDSTLNRGGIRIGTAEIYSALAKLAQIKDSLIVGLERANGNYFMPLFVVLNEGVELDLDLKTKIKKIIMMQFSPRHSPDDIYVINEVPYTLSGKKMETPVKNLFLGKDIQKVINRDAMRNPDAFNFFINFKKEVIDKLNYN
jgi:acetoacetyl-CoA synthetase